jgi:peptidyl-prolyl cis-trans isomerase B (cyclophilin B)
MGTEKRERQKAGRQARLAAAQAEAAKKKRTRSFVIIGGVVVILVAATLALGGLGGDDDGDQVATDGSTTTTALTSTTASPFPEVPLPEPGATIEGETPCPPADGSAERTTSFAQAPPDCLTEGATYQATITTDRGDIVVDLDAEAAPVTVNNFVVLSRYHFYDGVAFHRIIPQFMIQTGDPVGPTPGSGGPGYQFADELTGSETYEVGTLAMANAGPDTNGSQFFIMATGSGGLDPDYTVFGSVASGQEVVDEINALGDAATNGTPTEIVEIESVTITET